jgi:hypothetical protein
MNERGWSTVVRLPREGARLRAGLGVPRVLITRAEFPLAKRAWQVCAKGADRARSSMSLSRYVPLRSSRRRTSPPGDCESDSIAIGPRRRSLSWKIDSLDAPRGSCRKRLHAFHHPGPHSSRSGFSPIGESPYVAIVRREKLYREALGFMPSWASPLADGEEELLHDNNSARGCPAHTDRGR